jgi:urease accessory protein
MYPSALGAVGKQIELGPADVAMVAAQAAVSGPAWAATRLLGLDPFAVARCLRLLCPAVETMAASAATLVEMGAPSISVLVGALPAYGAPLLEIGAERHARWEVQLFAS